MVATKTNLLFLILTLCLHENGFSQQCGNCKTTPSVAVYDFDIQVAQPVNDEAAMQSWRQLFWLARHVNAYLFEHNKSCVRFTQPVFQQETQKTYLKDGIELPALVESPEIMKVGLTTANVPGAGDLSDFGNYITTGTIRKSGEECILHLELQVACNRKTIATSDAHFQLSSNSEYIQQIAHQAAIKFNPLIDKIKAYETEQRKGRSDFALGGNGRELIKIIPSKKIFLSGETADISVELKDCDGMPLAGRTIDFTGSKGEINIPGTEGGIVTPSKVVTDASGKATAKFKMTAVRGQAGIINAYTISETGKACTDAFFGTVKVDGYQAYKIEIEYKQNGTDGSGMKSNEDGVALKAGSGRFWEVDYFIEAYYNPPASQKADQQIIIMADPEIEKVDIEPLIPLVPIKSAHPVIIKYAKGTQLGKAEIYFSGRSELHGWGKDLSLLASPIGMSIDKEIEYETIVSDSTMPPAISMQFKNNELIFFSCALEFPLDDQGKQPVSGDFGIEINDKNYFPIKPTKINDPKSPYKSVYVLEYRKFDNYTPSGKVMKFDKNIMEVATVKIYSTF